MCNYARRFKNTARFCELLSARDSPFLAIPNAISSMSSCTELRGRTEITGMETALPEVEREEEEEEEEKKEEEDWEAGGEEREKDRSRRR